jgi:acyl carrier protein
MAMVAKSDALRLLEEMLDLRPQTLTGGECLKDLEAWDSLSTLMFIGLVDREFGVPLPGNRVAQCKTVDELCSLIGEAARSLAA